MNRFFNTRPIIGYFPMCLLVVLGWNLFTSPAAAQVFDPGPSDSALFDNVINLPPAPDIGQSETIGGWLNRSVERFWRRRNGNNFNGFFVANSGSEVNLVGTSFVLDGVSWNSSLTEEVPFTIVDRDVTLSGLLVGRTQFSFNLNPNPPVSEPYGDYFDPVATLTVTLSQKLSLGDGNGDGVLTFLDISSFIALLQA